MNECVNEYKTNVKYNIFFVSYLKQSVDKCSNILKQHISYLAYFWNWTKLKKSIGKRSMVIDYLRMVLNPNHLMRCTDPAVQWQWFSRCHLYSYLALAPAPHNYHVYNCPVRWTRRNAPPWSGYQPRRRLYVQHLWFHHFLENSII